MARKLFDRTLVPKIHAIIPDAGIVDAVGGRKFVVREPTGGPPRICVIIKAARKWCRNNADQCEIGADAFFDVGGILTAASAPPWVIAAGVLGTGAAFFEITVKIERRYVPSWGWYWDAHDPSRWLLLTEMPDFFWKAYELGKHGREAYEVGRKIARLRQRRAIMQALGRAAASAMTRDGLKLIFDSSSTTRDFHQLYDQTFHQKTEDESSKVLASGEVRPSSRVNRTTTPGSAPLSGTNLAGNATRKLASTKSSFPANTDVGGDGDLDAALNQSMTEEMGADNPYLSDMLIDSKDRTLKK